MQTPQNLSRSLIQLKNVGEPRLLDEFQLTETSQYASFSISNPQQNAYHNRPMVEWIKRVCHWSRKLGSIFGRVKPRQQKLVFTASLLDVQQ